MTPVKWTLALILLLSLGGNLWLYRERQRAVCDTAERFVHLEMLTFVKGSKEKVSSEEYEEVQTTTKATRRKCSESTRPDLFALCLASAGGDFEKMLKCE